MADPPLLEVIGLTQRFGGLVALDEVSLAVRAGELVSLIGPNGAGKTTAFDIMAGFRRPTGGLVVFDGQNLAGRLPHERARLGLVRTYQQAAVFGNQTALDCVVVASHLVAGPSSLADFLGTRVARRDRIARVDRALDILDRCGLRARAGTPAPDLPYGDQKILGIAIALAANPRLLMLDEPTAGLNPVESEAVSELLDQLNEDGLPILLVEHDMQVVMGLSDRVIVLDHGRVIADGGPEQVRANEAVVQAYLGDFEVA